MYLKELQFSTGEVLCVYLYIQLCGALRCTDESQGKMMLAGQSGYQDRVPIGQLGFQKNAIHGHGIGERAATREVAAPHDEDVGQLWGYRSRLRTSQFLSLGVILWKGRCQGFILSSSPEQYVPFLSLPNRGG